MPDPSPNALTPPRSFEDALRELEEILQKIEAGEIGLEQSLAQYERGNSLIQYCRGVLGGAEKRIEQLSRNADGLLQAMPGGSPSAETSPRRPGPAPAPAPAPAAGPAGPARSAGAAGTGAEDIF